MGFTHYTYFFLLNSIINYDFKNKDFFNAFRNGVPIAIYISRTFFHFCLIFYQDTLIQIITFITADYANMNKMDLRLQKIVNDYAEKSLGLSKRCVIMLVSLVLVFMSKSIYKTTTSYIKYGVIKLVPYHEMHYPITIEEYRHNILVFIATYCGELNFTVSSVMIYFTSIPLGPIFILHACGQLELIKIKLENVFLDDNVDEKLNDIVMHLQKIYKFVSKIDKCFALMYEVALKKTMIVLPFIAYATVQSISQGNFTIEYVSVFAATILMSSCICLYSNLLMDKGEEVRQAAYMCGWERVHNPRVRTTLLIILTRAAKPVAIKSIFSTISLDMLLDVYRQSYTIFSLMNAMWN